MKYEDKPIEKENFLPFRKRPLLQTPKDTNTSFKEENTSKIKDVQIQNEVIVPVQPYYSPKQEEKLDGFEENPYLQNSSQSQIIYERQHSQSQEFDEHDDKLYCICKEKYNQHLWMIGCDICNEWFHGKCIGITALEARRIKLFVCLNCTTENQKTLYKQAKKKPKKEEVQEDKKRQIPSTEEILAKRKKKTTKVVQPLVRCICTNNQTDIPMIQCERCRSWLHCSCLKIDQNDIPKNFMCLNCKNFQNFKGHNLPFLKHGFEEKKEVREENLKSFIIPSLSAPSLNHQNL